MDRADCPCRHDATGVGELERCDPADQRGCPIVDPFAWFQFVLEFTQTGGAGVAPAVPVISGSNSHDVGGGVY